MATGPIEKHLHRSFNWENAAPGARKGTRGAFGWLRERPIRSMCSAEIGNQPLVIYIAIARWTGTILSSSGSILLFSASRSNAI